MGWFNDVVDFVGDTAEDAVDTVTGAAEDAADWVEGAAEDAANWVEGAVDDVVGAVVDAAQSIADAAEAAVDAVATATDAALDALGEAADDAWDAAQDVWDHVTNSAEDAWGAVADAAEDAWDAVGNAAEAAWEAVSTAAEDAWEDVTAAAEDAWEGISAAAEDAWDGLETAATTVAGTVATLYEEAAEAAERAVEWFGSLIVDIVDLILELGACLAGQIVYSLAKADNVLSNIDKAVQMLPEPFEANMTSLLGGPGFKNVFFIDGAQLSANRFGSGTLAMTFAGVTVAGVTITNLIFVGPTFDPADATKRQLMCHELVHVTQYRRFVTEPAFACAYGIGYVQAGFDYRTNPLEAQAYDFVAAHAGAI